MLVGCRPPPAGATVLILGDSLTAEAHRSGEADARLNTYKVDWAGSLYGAAPCNGLATARKVAKPPDVVVIAYSGNGNGVVDNCMSGETGTARSRRYVKDVTSIVTHFDNGHTRIVIVGAPVRTDVNAAGTGEIFTALRRLAVAKGIAFSDGGADISPGRTYRTTGACLAGERVCGTGGPGRNTLRNPDGVHFCPTRGPDRPTFFGQCPDTYSSGAVRYTMNLLTAITVSVAPA